MRRRIPFATAGAVLLLSGLHALPLSPASEKPAPEAEKKSGFAALPVVFYTPETRWAWGAGGLVYFPLTKDKSVSRPSNIAFSAVFTQNKQYSLDLNPDFYFRHGYHLQSEFEYSKFPDKFFGIGSNTPASLEEPFTSRYWKLRLEALKKVVGTLNLGFEYLFDSVTMTEVQEGGQLASGAVPGSAGGVVSGGGFFMTIDSRDSIFFPTTGNFHQISALGFGSALGSDFSFGRFGLDARRYVRFSMSRVLALQSQILIQTGQPPFWRMGMLGGEKGLRGYYLGRYRDNNMVYLQAEYRWVPVFWRIGLAGFAGLGEVADRLDGLRLDRLKYACGLGLRFVVDSKQRLHLRLEYAIGKDSSAVYFTAGEAF